MKKIIIAALLCSISIGLFFTYYVHAKESKKPLLLGAFLADAPTKEDIAQFKRKFGKSPYFVLVFIDWPNFLSQTVLKDIFLAGSLPVVTWEPWSFQNGVGVSFDAIVHGTFDEYIDGFARQLGKLQKTVYLRFAHEMNGDWYPWSSSFIGGSKYKAAYRYIKDRFDALSVRNVRWIFSINYEDVPSSNSYTKSYPGDAYVDYIGVDGYNWGYAQAHSTWKSFREIFVPIYKNICVQYSKDVLITEFGSTSRGGNKAKWLLDAFSDMKKMKRLRGCILFNVDKETDWAIPEHGECENILKKQLSAFINDIQETFA